MRDRKTAALLALFGGIAGLHFFYLGKKGLGFMSLTFLFLRWLPVNVIIGVVNFLILIGMSDDEFNRRYNSDFLKRRPRAGQDDPKRREYKQEPLPRYESMPQQSPNFGKNTSSAQQNSLQQKEHFKQEGLKNFKLFDYDDAVADFGKAIAIDPTDVSVHWNLSCCYSLTEQKELAFFHLQKAVENGFNDAAKIKTHEALSFLRVQPEFEAFVRQGYRMSEQMEHSDLLKQLNILQKRRAEGALSEKEFADLSKKLFE
jgi:tetratricopeptide (TPR) repeat protein